MEHPLRVVFLEVRRPQSVPGGSQRGKRRQRERQRTGAESLLPGRQRRREQRQPERQAEKEIVLAGQDGEAAPQAAQEITGEGPGLSGVRKAEQFAHRQQAADDCQVVGQQAEGVTEIIARTQEHRAQQGGGRLPVAETPAQDAEKRQPPADREQGVAGAGPLQVGSKRPHEARARQMEKRRGRRGRISDPETRQPLGEPLDQRPMAQLVTAPKGGKRPARDEQHREADQERGCQERKPLPGGFPAGGSDWRGDGAGNTGRHFRPSIAWPPGRRQSRIPHRFSGSWKRVWPVAGGEGASAGACSSFAPTGSAMEAQERG